jgi:hypothetical protein
MYDTDIIAYNFDGATYHVECINRSIRKQLNASCTCGEYDSNGLCENNCHGYGPNPVFGSDEGSCDVCLLPLTDE